MYHIAAFAIQFCLNFKTSANCVFTVMWAKIEYHKKYPRRRIELMKKSTQQTSARWGSMMRCLPIKTDMQKSILCVILCIAECALQFKTSFSIEKYILNINCLNDIGKEISLFDDGCALGIYIWQWKLWSALLVYIFVFLKLKMKIISLFEKRG